MLSARINNVETEVPDKIIPEDFKKMNEEEKKKLKIFQSKAMKKMEKEKQPGNFHDATKSSIPGHVDHYNVAEMTPKIFYQNYMSLNKPVFVWDGAKDWLAMSKWKDKKYLADQTKRT